MILTSTAAASGCRRLTPLFRASCTGVVLVDLGDGGRASPSPAASTYRIHKLWIEHVYDGAVPGAPELKEAGWLVPSGTRPDDEYPRYLMFVRFQQQMDDPHGWTVELHECQRPGRKVKHWYATECDARAAVRAL